MAKLEEVIELKAKLEKMEAEAKEEQKNLYLKKLAETEAIATKYKELFGEELTFRGKPKKAKAGAQEKTWKPQQPISLDEINSFLTQKKEGKKSPQEYCPRQQPSPSEQRDPPKTPSAAQRRRQNAWTRKPGPSSARTAFGRY